MKATLLLLIPLLFVSCRTNTPLDPHTFKPSSRCLPEAAASGVADGSAK